MGEEEELFVFSVICLVSFLCNFEQVKPELLLSPAFVIRDCPAYSRICFLMYMCWDRNIGRVCLRLGQRE